MLVRMRYYISGGRHDGRDWPDPAAGDATIEVPDWEGEDLIRGGHAVRVAQPAAGPATGPQPLPGRPPDVASPEPAAAADAAAAQPGDDAGGLPGEPAGPAAEPDVAAADQPAAAPGPSAAKQAWIEYAVSQGAALDEAAAMTKADLMSRYGGRL